MGEAQNQLFQFSFSSSSLKVDFQGSRVTSEAGVLLVRELDESAAERMPQWRRRKLGIVLLHILLGLAAVLPIRCRSSSGMGRSGACIHT